MFYRSEIFTTRPLIVNLSLSSRASQPIAAATTSAGALIDFLMEATVCPPSWINNPQTSPATRPISSAEIDGWETENADFLAVAVVLGFAETAAGCFTEFIALTFATCSLPPPVGPGVD